jgi:hypothetical protein
VRFYNPALDVQLENIGPFKGSKHSAISSLFPSIAHALGFPENTHFLAFECIPPSTAKKVLDSATFATSIAPISLIVQLEPGEALPPTEHEWTKASQAPPLELQTAVAETKYPNLTVFRSLPGQRGTVDQFLRASVEAVVFSWQNQQTPVCRVEFAPAIVIDQFKSFLASALSLSYNPAVSSLIVYKKDITEDKPGAVVNGDPRYGLSYEFSASALTEFHIWVKFLPDVPESQLALLQELTVYITDLGTLSTRTHQLFVPKTSARSSCPLDW